MRQNSWENSLQNLRIVGPASATASEQEDGSKTNLETRSSNQLSSLLTRILEGCRHPTRRARSYIMHALHAGEGGGGFVKRDGRNYLPGCNTIYIRPDPCLPFPCWQAFHARTKHDEPFIFAHRGPVYTLPRGRGPAPCIHKAVARPRVTRGKRNRLVKFTFNWPAYRRSRSRRFSSRR